jgi:diacylglycerol kinase (ATP)
MRETAEILAIFNPASGGGRTARNRESLTSRLRSALGPRCRIVETTAPGHAFELGREAALQQLPSVIVAGGDGTLHETVNGMYDAAPAGPHPTIGILACGSGNGLALSLGLPRNIDEQIDIIRAGGWTRIDAGRIEFNASGKTGTRVYVNECQIGIGADVVADTSANDKRSGGLLGYGLTVLQTLGRPRHARASITADCAPMWAGEMLGCAVGNGEITAGGMHLFPGADTADGLLDLLVITHQSLFSRLRSFQRIYAGTQLQSDAFLGKWVKSVAIVTGEALRVAADGECLGTTPCSVTVLPAGIRCFTDKDIHGVQP